MKYLIVAAHPDDEVLGCGGTVLKLNYKQDVFCLVLNKGGRKEPVLVDEAAKFMKYKDYWQLGFPDQKFDTVPLVELTQEIERVKNIVKPDVVFTHFEWDLNKDHQLTYQAVLTATRPMAGETVKELFSFEIPSSTEWKFPNTFAPNFFIDISDTIDKKIECLKLYDSEMREYPHPRSVEGIKTIAKRWGIMSGLPCAEAFILVRKVQ